MDQTRLAALLALYYAHPVYKESGMDRWLNDAPALAHVKGFCTWVVVNNNCKVIAWSDDPAELAWLSGWILESTETQKKEADLGVGDSALKTGGRRSNRVSPLRSARKAG